MPPGTRRNHQPYTRGSLSAGHGDASTRALVNFGAEQNSSRRSLNQSTVLSDRTALIMSRPATLGATRSPRDVAVGRATRVLSLAVWPGDGGVVRRGNNIDGAVLLFVIAVVARAVIGAMSERLAASVAESLADFPTRRGAESRSGEKVRVKLAHRWGARRPGGGELSGLWGPAQSASWRSSRPRISAVVERRVRGDAWHRLTRYTRNRDRVRRLGSAFLKKRDVRPERPDQCPLSATIGDGIELTRLPIRQVPAKDPHRRLA
jgi:hypothetical protein